MQTIEEINAYLKVQGVRLEFDSIQDLVTAYLQCREANKNLLAQSCKTIEQVKAELEHSYIASLSKDTYQLAQLEKMTLLELAELIS